MRNIDRLVTQEYDNDVFIHNESYYFCGKIEGWCTRTVLMDITNDFYIKQRVSEEVDRMSEENKAFKQVSIKEENTKKRKMSTQKVNKQKKQTIVQTIVNV